MPMPELRDYAAERLPQRFRAPLRGEMPRPCPLTDRLLYCDEGPHARTWLVYRGDTVRLRNEPRDAYLRLLRASARYRRACVGHDSGNIYAVVLP